MMYAVSVTTLRFVVGDTLPKVDYRTMIDTYVEVCFYLQLATLFATAGRYSIAI
jgi:hypothetical protein